MTIPGLCYETCHNKTQLSNSPIPSELDYEIKKTKQPKVYRAAAIQAQQNKLNCLLLQLVRAKTPALGFVIFSTAEWCVSGAKSKTISTCDMRKYSINWAYLVKRTLQMVHS